MRSTIWLPIYLSFWAVAFADTAESTGPVPDDAKADGTVTLSGGSVAAGIGYTRGHGEYLRNEHGVVIKLIAKEKGLKFNLSADGVRIALTR